MPTEADLRDWLRQNDDEAVALKDAFGDEWLRVCSDAVHGDPAALQRVAHVLGELHARLEEAEAHAACAPTTNTERTD